MANWYAVYTRPRWEKKVLESLQRRRIEAYCPMTKVGTPWSATDRRRAIYQPVFESYVFVKTTEDQLRTIKQTDGVVNIVFWRDKPAVVREIEVEMIKRFLQEHESVTLEKASVNTTEIVKIINSNVEDMHIQMQKVKLVLPSLGYTMEALVETEVEIRMQPNTRPINTSLAKFG